MKVRELLELVDEAFPLSLALDWDNSGMQVGDPEDEVGRVLVCLDVSGDVVAEALKFGCNVIVSHHPLIFRGIRSLRRDETLGRILFRLVESGISVLSFHTNVDAAEGGLADFVAHLLGLEVEGPLTSEGIGRVCRGSFSNIDELVEKIKGALGKDVPLRLVEGPFAPIERVAVCPGSGGDLIGEAFSKGVQCYITGDVKYHAAQEALGRMWVVDAGHYHTELPFCSLMASFLEDRGLDCVVAESQKNPFRYTGGM